MKWFEEVFLPSLFDKAGINHAMWLSRKQTAICTENMTAESCMDELGYRHTSYKTTYNGREVSMQYSKKNGCGQITFGATEEEVKESMQEYNKRRIERVKNSAKVMLERRSERVPKRLAELQRLIDSVLFALEDETNPDLQSNLKQTLAEYKAEYTVLMNGKPCLTRAGL